jgi:DNA-binding transcriptional LysR family regulator
MHFLAVVEEGSFTGAAARMFMVQSSLSASLLALERELGTDLFIRGRRGSELTDAGRALQEPARAALDQADRAHDAVAEFKGLLRGSVRVAAAGVPRSIDVGETIRQFHDHHPGVAVHVVSAGDREVPALVAEGQVDFGIAPRPDRTGSALRFEPLLSTPVVLICPTDHRLAGLEDLDVREVIDEPIIDLPRGWPARDLFDRMLEDLSSRRSVRLEVGSWMEVLSMVQRRVGIAYGPKAWADDDMFSGLGIATLENAPTSELGIVSRDPALRGAAGRAFLAAYRRRLRTLVTPTT